jgi:hypothetical protein
MSAVVLSGARSRKRGASTTRDYTEKGCRVAALGRIIDNPWVTLGNFIQ